MRRFDLTYSAANKGTASELMIFSDIEFCPTPEQMIAQPCWMMENRRGQHTEQGKGRLVDGDEEKRACCLHRQQALLLWVA